MPINRGDKHWCNPVEDGTPSERSGTWTCPDCKTKWRWWPDLNTWAHAKDDMQPMLDALAAPAAEEAPKEGDQ